MLSIGIIGFGRLGKIHAANVATSSHASITAICDLSKEELTIAKRLYGCNTFDTAEEFFKEKLDGVIVASSTSFHLEHIREASKYGIPIFTEKPVGLTMETTDRVLAPINSCGTPFQIGFQRRWDERFNKLREIVRNGGIGEPLLYKAYGRDPDASNPLNWGLPKNGGLFLNAAIHDYDAARFVLGQDMTHISAIGATVRHKDLMEYDDYDTAITTMLSENGVLVTTEWSRYAVYGFDMGVEVVGTTGAVRISQRESDIFVIYHENSGAPTVIDVFSDSYKRQIDAFLNALLENHKPSPGIHDARIALNMALTARESASQNGKMLPVVAPSELVLDS